MPVVLAPLLYHNQLDITEERQVMVPQTSPEVRSTIADWLMLGYHIQCCYWFIVYYSKYLLSCVTSLKSLDTQ